jgi:hypothetical protein
MSGGFQLAIKDGAKAGFGIDLSLDKDDGLSASSEVNAL